MNINFIVNLLNSKTLNIFDISNINLSLPLEIYDMKIYLTGSRLEEDLFEFDVMSYLKLQRLQNEILTITSDKIGLDYNLDLPDGVYHFKYVINNTIQKENVILIYQNIKSEVDKMLIDTDYKVEVDNEEMKYINDTVNDKYNIERVRYAKVLLDILEQSTQSPDEVLVNNTLDKLERLLTIIKN